LSVDGVLGLSPVSQAANVLNLSDALVKHALSYFDDGSTYPGGVPRPAGILNLGGDPTATQQNLEREHLRNVSRPHGILVLRGEATYTPVATSLDSQQFAEQRRLAAAEIARVFRIPPHLIGAPTGDSLTYTTVEQQSLDFVRFSLQPWLRRIELAISGDADLAFARQYVKFEVDALLRSDALTRTQVYEKALASGWLTVEEVRRLEDLDPAPQRPAVIVPGSLQALAPTGANNNGSS
jgi:HK97 family phage portal protein